jgi:hypothetical protein
MNWERDENFGASTGSQEALKIVSCACFHSVMNCELTFWGNSSHSAKIYITNEYNYGYYRMQK